MDFGSIFFLFGQPHVVVINYFLLLSTTFSRRGAPKFGSFGHLSHLFGRNLICVAGGVAIALSRIAARHRKTVNRKP